MSPGTAQASPRHWGRAQSMTRVVALSISLRAGTSSRAFRPDWSYHPDGFFDVQPVAFQCAVRVRGGEWSLSTPSLLLPGVRVLGTVEHSWWLHTSRQRHLNPDASTRGRNVLSRTSQSRWGPVWFKALMRNRIATLLVKGSRIDLPCGESRSRGFPKAAARQPVEYVTEWAIRIALPRQECSSQFGFLSS